MPAANEILASAPDHVTLSFGENLLVISGKTTNTLEVTNSQGDILSSEPVNVIGSEITTSLDSQRMVEGKYSVSYRIVAADGHPVKGSFVFTISKSVIRTPTPTAKDQIAKKSNPGYFERNARSFGIILTILGLLISSIIYRNRKP